MAIPHPSNLVSIFIKSILTPSWFSTPSLQQLLLEADLFSPPTLAHKKMLEAFTAWNTPGVRAGKFPNPETASALDIKPGSEEGGQSPCWSCQ